MMHMKDEGEKGLGAGIVWLRKGAKRLPIPVAFHREHLLQEG
jgi:hypothetical protein